MAHNEDERTLYIGEIDEPEFFNKGIKNRYLESLNGNIEKIENFFKRSSWIETWHGKDIYQFKDDELEMLFHSYGFEEESQLKRAHEIVEEYIEWAICQNLTDSTMNVMYSWKEHNSWKKYKNIQ